MPKIIGIAKIAKNATTASHCLTDAPFLGQIVYVTKILPNSLQVCLRNQPHQHKPIFAVFDFIDICGWFRCTYFNNIVCPPSLDGYYATKYINKLNQAYPNPLALQQINNTIIAISLGKNEFTDYFAFPGKLQQTQPEQSQWS